jgi:predicted DCC family thiol-disulfide oxidoreductase YuxK
LQEWDNGDVSTLVYDGDCAFCTSSVRLMERLRLRADHVIPWQHADLAALGLTAEVCQKKLQWVADDRRISDGHRAIARLLLANALPWRPLGALLLVPPVSWLASVVYDLVAANRSKLPGGTPACAVPPRDEDKQAS